MELETTVNGQSFYESGLAYFTPTNRNIIGLPGLGPAATKKCISFGLISAECVFGQYLAFRRNREVFLDYLENIVGVTS
jgi:hypothetical protein